ncbi:MAG: hypothetical protein GWP19_13515 [Planctomycetia bacterium]|nr:hypothetical protein [Planctomycetia bacterium]
MFYIKVHIILILLPILLCTCSENLPEDLPEDEELYTVSGEVISDHKFVIGDFPSPLVQLKNNGTVIRDTMKRYFTFTGIPKGVYQISVTKECPYGNFVYGTQPLIVDSISIDMVTVLLDSIKYDYFPLNVGNYYKYTKHYQYSYSTTFGPNIEDEGFIYIDQNSFVEFEITAKILPENPDFYSNTYYQFQRTETIFYKETFYDYMFANENDTTIIDTSIVILNIEGEFIENSGGITANIFYNSNSTSSPDIHGYHVIVHRNWLYNAYHGIGNGPLITIGGEPHSSIIIYRGDDKNYFSPSVGLTKLILDRFGSSTYKYIEMNLVEYNFPPIL